MPPLAPRILAAALLEGDDLRAAHMIQHFGPDRRTFNGGGAKHSPIAADPQDLTEFHTRAGRSFEPVDPKHVLGDNAILLAARFDDREHLFLTLVFVHGTRTQGPGPASFDRDFTCRCRNLARTNPLRAKARGPRKSPRGGITYGGLRPSCPRFVPARFVPTRFATDSIRY